MFSIKAIKINHDCEFIGPCCYEELNWALDKVGVDRLRLQGSDEEDDHGVEVEENVHGEEVEEVDLVRKTMSTQLKNVNDRGLMRVRSMEISISGTNAVVEKTRQKSEGEVQRVDIDPNFEAPLLKSLAETRQSEIDNNAIDIGCFEMGNMLNKVDEGSLSIIKEGSRLENDEQIRLGNFDPVVENIICSSPNGILESQLGNLNLVVDLTQFVPNKETNGLKSLKKGISPILEKGEYSKDSNEFEIHGTVMEFHSKSLMVGTKKAFKIKKGDKSPADVKEDILDKVNRKCQRRGRKQRNCVKEIQSKEACSKVANASLSNSDFRKKKHDRYKEAKDTWEVGKKLGLTANYDDDIIIEKLMHVVDKE
ncbi:hypothetical protein REPUB_Repub02eG0210700 [Reevesia pubescens]